VKRTAEPKKPTVESRYLASHVKCLLASYRHWTGEDLVDPALSAEDQARELFHAPFVVLSHNTAADPILNYTNEAGLRLFELSWNELIAMPSRLTSQTPDQLERSRLLAAVAKRGFIDDYRGVRITKSGRCFAIERATVWNLLDENGAAYGQAATFADWRFLA
jgi:MEKHLA domain-containing protein